jgi:hypothetical protein
MEISQGNPTIQHMVIKMLKKGVERKPTPNSYFVEASTT